MVENIKPIRKRGLYYVILGYRDSSNKRKQKWIPTEITEKENNKRLANQKLEELQTLFEKSKDDPLEIVIQIASFYGLRRSEVLGLKGLYLILKTIQ